jgi:outer membrane protein assembly factor BamD (BamD/ComL family)
MRGLRFRRSVALAGLLAAVLTPFAGCSWSGSPIARWRIAHDKAISPPPSIEETGDERRGLSRLFTPERAPAKVDREVRGAGLIAQSKTDPAVEEEFRAARQLLEDGRLDEAEKAFIRLDRKREHGSIPDLLGLGKKSSDDKSLTNVLRKSQPAWGEKALYYLAETQYKRGKLVDAHDTIDKLLTNYPGTQFLDEAVGREYEIAQIWLDASDPKATGEKRGQVTDRFVGRLPPVDLSGHALQVLEHVRQHDVSGPRAPEAAMKIADFHYARGDYEEASTYYDQLISAHPRSHLVYDAYLKTIDAKMKSYVGPKYDATGLDKAKDQIHQVMTLYPEHHAENGEKLSHMLDLIDDQVAEMTFRQGEFYKQTGFPGAAELCYGELKTRWPNSPWTKLAGERMEEIARMPRKKVEPSKIMARPGSTDPFAGGMTSGTASGASSPLTSPGGP